jgi:hypothetical protein
MDTLFLSSSVTNNSGNAFGGPVGLTYAWTGPNGFISTGTNPFIAPTPLAGAGNYAVTVSLNPGNTSTNCPGTTANVNVQVTPGPVFSLGPDLVICHDASSGPLVINIGDSSLLGNSGYTYTWNTGDSVPVITVTISQDTCFELTVTDTLTGCSLSDTICIYLNPPDQTQLTIAQNCQTLCFVPGAVVQTNTPAPNYSFDFWGQGPPSGSDFTEVVNTTVPSASVSSPWCYGTDYGTYQVTVQVNYGMGCVAFDTATIYHYDYTSLAGIDTTLCPAPDSLVLGDPLLSTLPLGAFGYGFIITWTDLITSQVYNQANPLVDLHPGTTNVFQLHIITPDGCHFYDTVSIITCCFADVGKSIQIIPANSVVNNSTVTQTHVWVQGDITIDGDVLWSNKFIRMAPQARIIIPPTINSYPLNYIRLVLDETQVFADCDTMWTGIQVYGDTTYYDSAWAGLVHIRNSIIRDAEIGIHSIDAGSFIVQKANLIDNHIHIVVAPFPNYFPNNNIIDHPSFLDGAILDCKNPLINPFAGERTYMGINVTKPSVNFIEHYTIVGVGTLPNYRPSISNNYNRNTIRNCDLGINANNASLFIENTDFSDIACNSTYSNPCIIPVLNQRPTAIRFHGNGTDLIVDDNTFNKCDIGVNSIATATTEITRNSISSSIQGILLQSHTFGSTIKIERNSFQDGNWGIFAFRNVQSTFNIFDNTIVNFDRGIQFTFNPSCVVDCYQNNISDGELGIESFANNFSVYDIHHNFIDNTSRFGVLTRGITLTEASPGTQSTIANNDIRVRHAGIFLNGQSTGLNFARNRFNIISLVPNIIPFWGLPPGWISMSNFGIYFLNTTSARATKNNIYGPTLYSTGVTDWQNNFRGICLDGSVNNQIFCNYLRDTRDGIQVVSGNPNSRIMRNEYMPGRTALTLSTAAFTGVQGSSTLSMDNEFHCQFTVSALRSENGFGFLSTHYVRSTPSALYTPASCFSPMTFTNSPFTSPISTPTATGGFATFLAGNDICPGIQLRTGKVASEDYEEELNPFPDAQFLVYLLDSLPWDSIEIDDPAQAHAIWQLQRQVYQMIHIHDSLRQISARLDSFYIMNDSLAFGMLRRAADLEAEGELEDALLELSSVSSTDSLSSLYTYVRESMLMMQLGLEWDSLSTPSRDSLFTISLLCPQHYGSAVYLARALITQFESQVLISDCELQEMGAPEIDSTYTPPVPSGSCLHIYPNPGDEEITIELTCNPEAEYRLMIINNQGNIMEEHEFISHEPELIVNTSAWAQGLYHVILFHYDMYLENRVVAILHY